MMKNTFLAVAIAVIGVGAAMPLVSRAQDQPQGQGAQMRREFRRGPGGPMGDPLMLRGVMRDLSDAQRQQVQAIHERHADRLRPAAERARAAREALNTAIISGDDGNLQALSIEIGNAETELTFARAQVQSEIFKVLTPEQKQRIAERRKQMEERRGEMMKRRQNRQ